MNGPKHRHPRKKRTEHHGKSPNYGHGKSPNYGRGKSPGYKERTHPESTGTESTYLKSLIEDHTPVTVTMISGEQFHGHIRYYDRYCFSIGLSSEKRNIFLRKDSVSHITEE